MLIRSAFVLVFILFYFSTYLQSRGTEALSLLTHSPPQKFVNPNHILAWAGRLCLSISELQWLVFHMPCGGRTRPQFRHLHQHPPSTSAIITRRQSKKQSNNKSVVGRRWPHQASWCVCLRTALREIFGVISSDFDSSFIFLFNFFFVFAVPPEKRSAPP